MRRIIILLTLTILCLPTLAQTRAETKLYDKTIAAGDLKSYDKFLNKYPSSVYASDILARKDTLLNISPYSMADAVAIASRFLGDESAISAFATRSNAVDRIDAVSVAADSLVWGDCRILAIQKEDGDWKVLSKYDRSLFDQELVFSETAQVDLNLVDSSFVSTVSRQKALFFNILVAASGAGDDEAAYVAAAYFPESERLNTVAFKGKNILKAGEDGYRIHGRSDFDETSKDPSLLLMNKNISENPLLDRVSDAEFNMNEIVSYWFSHNNPHSNKQQMKLTVPVLPEVCSLRDEFAKAKAKVSSSKYTAALFDFNGMTFIIVKQKTDGELLLAWIEPLQRAGVILNSIFFDDANTISMAYYHGKKYYKYHYNLTSKVLSK